MVELINKLKSCMVRKHISCTNGKHGSLVIDSYVRIYVIGFAKTVPIGTTIEIHFMA